MSTKDLQNSDYVQDGHQNENPELNEKKKVTRPEKKDLTKENSEPVEDEKIIEDTIEDKPKEVKSENKESVVEITDDSKNEEVEATLEDAELKKPEIEDEKIVEITKEEKLEDVQTKNKDAVVENEEIEVASEDVEKESNDEKVLEEKVEIDYTKLSREDLVKELNDLVNIDSINEIRKEVEAIKASFYKKQKALNEKIRKEFIANDGIIEDFVLEEDPVEIELKELFKRYRKYKADYNRQLEGVKESNLSKKYEIIEELKELVNKDESIGETFREFRELQTRWKETGQVPQPKLKDLWNTYHHHVEKFYDYVNINKELRDLDVKKNLEIKLQLCEKAEALVEDSSVVNSFKTLQKLHNQWREIGPVPNDQKNDLWERFKEATRLINKKHQDYFKNLKDEQKNNLDKKDSLCVQAEAIAEKELNAHKDWIEQTAEIIELQKVWRTIGFAPKKDNNKIYARFRNACDKFFGMKREFYALNKELQDVNLNKKIALCEKAEEIKDSTDWKKTTQELISIQKEWKEIGPVSRKQSDKIWKRFRAACDYFFNHKTEYYSNIEEEFDKNLKLKQEVIEKVKSYQFTSDVNENYEALKKFQEEFSELGFVPYKLKDKIQNEFREELNKQFDKLKMDDSEKNLLKFQNRLDTLQHKPKSSNKIKQERDKFFNKIKKLESNISLWENNIGFFSAGSDQAKEMLKDYQERIDSARKEIVMLEEKVRMIDRADTE